MRLHIPAILYLINISESYKILLISPFATKSHVIINDSFANYLLKAGHEVTYITTAPQNFSQKEKNISIIDVTDNKVMKDKLDKFVSIKSIMEKNITPQNSRRGITIVLENARMTLSNEAVQNLLKDKSRNFDVIIVEWMFTEVYAGFAAVYKCPMIWFSTLEPHWMVLRLIDEALNPAYSNSAISTSLPIPLTFSQRIVSLYDQLYMQYLYYTLIYDLEEELYKEYLVPHTQKFIPLEVLRYNASLILGNSHVSLGVAARLPQSYKPIGGFHIERDVKPLPENIRTIMDKATDGIIYFSMGSNLSSKEFSKELIEKLLIFFGGLTQTVIWKFEDKLPNRPSNVHIFTWTPQQSILAHANCVLFISHGGMLSIMEAIHFGVPIVAIPVFGDQFVNVQRAVIKGFAKKVDLTYNLVEDLEVQVKSILKEPKYTAKAKEVSFIYHDRPVTPEAELVHWVEHVVKTRGALHLRSPALHVPFYQKYYLDLCAFVLFAITLVFFFIKIMYRVFLVSSSLGWKKLN